MTKRIIITGASGFIGKALVTHLINNNYEVVALSRDPATSKERLGERVIIVKWDARGALDWLEYADGAEAIVNLAGENVASGLWTKVKKRKIRESRLYAGQAVTEAVEKVAQKPKVIIQASSIGYYGSQEGEILDESSPAGSDFLAELTKDWEQSTRRIEEFGVRQVVIRIGLVLGKDGGLLSRVVLPFRLFIGGHFGKGKQWFSWIHIDDITQAIHFLLINEHLHGAFNLTAPQQLVSKEFFKSVGNQLNRPSWFHVPAAVLKMFFGEMAEEMFLASQRVVPKKLLDAGYEFRFPTVESALEQILGSENK